MFWFGGFILNGCVLAFAFRPVPKLHHANSSKKHSLKTMFDISVLTLGAYWLFAFAYACNTFQMCVSYQMYTSKVIAEGMDKMSASLLVSVIGISAAISRVIFSIIANFQCTNHVMVFGLSSIVLGVFNVFSFIPWNFLTHAFVCAVFGVSVGKLFMCAVFGASVGKLFMCTVFGASVDKCLVNG